MRALVLLLAAFAVTDSSLIPLAPHTHPISSLYHGQDVWGQYSYGYATPTSTKAETKTADGVTRGGYSYIDSHGLLQTVHYVADSVHGFRVAATNLPQDLPEVAAAKAQHLAAYAHTAAAVQYSNPQVVPAAQVQDLPEVAAAKARHLAILNAAYAERTAPVLAVAVPQPVQDLPEVARARAEHLAIVAQTRARDAAAHFSPVTLTGNVAPVHVATPVVATPIATSAQYHAQDGLGQYSYGYVGPLSAKSEAKGADGVTRGGYSYIDANGVLQTVNYIADSVNGFRVAATNLPVGPSAPVVESKVVGVKVAPELYTHSVIY